MKIINYLILVFLLWTFSCTAQINTVNIEELANISFNDIKLTQIRSIRGIDENAEALFGKGNFESKANTSGPDLGRDFWNEDITFGFEDSSNSGNYFYLLYLYVNHSNVQVTVKDVTVSIGDDIDAFQGYNISENNHWVVFADEDTSTIDITFIFNPSTRKITEIKMYTY